MAAIFRDGIYTELEEETLLFDRSFDFVVAPEITLIMKQESFQGSLDYLADVRANAVEILVSVTAEVPIHNFEELSAAVSRQLGMISKLASVAERFRTDPAYAASMNLENIIAFAGAHPEHEIDLEGPEDDKKLRFYPDPQRRWKILKLLDDDYLFSQLTSQIRRRTQRVRSSASRRCPKAKVRHLDHF